MRFPSFSIEKIDAYTRQEVTTEEKLRCIGAGITLLAQERYEAAHEMLGLAVCAEADEREALVRHGRRWGFDFSGLDQFHR